MPVLGKGKRLTFTRSISDKRMSQQEWHEAEQIMAKLVARAWAAEHPELFGPKLQETLDRRRNDGDTGHR